MEKLFLSPAEIAELTVENSRKKAGLRLDQMILLGILAGAFIALAGQGSNMAACHLLAVPETFGLGKALAGVLFAAGLMMVVLCGGELFTGNSLIFMGVLERRVSLAGMLRNWLFVYLGNLIGSVLVAFLVVSSGQLGSCACELGGMTVKIAVGKVTSPFPAALILGVLCNWLVCLAVWMATAAKDVTGKIWAIFFPIFLFVTSGFEHSVANMYYIPAGIFAKDIPAYADAAMGLGVTAEQLSSLNWQTMWTGNLFPVTLGNILGGGVFVALFYWLIYLRQPGQKKSGAPS